MIMDLILSKKEKRLQNKHNKLLALSNIMKLNDLDRGSLNAATETGTEDAELNHAKRSADSLNGIDGSECKKFKIDAIEMPHVKKHEHTNASPDNTPKKIGLSKDEYAQLKKELTARKKQLKRGPKFRLKDAGEYATLAVKQKGRTPIFLTDIQDLLMSVIYRHTSPCTPARWCAFERINSLSNTVVLVIDGLSLFHYLSFESKLVQTDKMFENKLEIILPHGGNGTILKELAFGPLLYTKKERLIETHGSFRAGIESIKDTTLLTRSVFPIEECQSEESIENHDKFSRTQLLVTASDMAEESYPIPLHGFLSQKYKSFVLTKEKYKRVTERSPLFGVDCEMCLNNKNKHELARISILNENMECIYDSLVKPTNKIVDYLTKYSGITADLLKKAEKNLKEIQKEVSNLLPPDAILVGQSLNFDLQAMQMMHPYVIDTSMIFNFTGDRKRRSKLKVLAKEFLEEDIQVEKSGHDPIEDSRTCLKLAKLKLSKSIDFGDAVLLQRRKPAPKGEQKEKPPPQPIRKSVFVSSNDTTFDFAEFVTSKTNQNYTEHQQNPIECLKLPTNESAIAKIEEISKDYSLILANLKVAEHELELEKAAKTISKVDDWIQATSRSVQHNGMFIVVFGGAPGTTSGVVMVKIKKDINAIVLETPITI